MAYCDKPWNMMNGITFEKIPKKNRRMSKRWNAWQLDEIQNLIKCSETHGEVLGYSSIYQSASSQQFTSIMDASLTQSKAGFIKITKSLALKPSQVKTLLINTYLKTYISCLFSWTLSFKQYLHWKKGIFVQWDLRERIMSSLHNIIYIIK